MINDIYTLFFQGQVSDKETFIKKVELLKLKTADIKKLLELINGEWLEQNNVSIKDFKKETVKSTSKPKEKAKAE